MIGIWLRIGIAALFYLVDVVQEAGDGERLAVAQFDFRLGIALGQRGNPETGDRDAVGESSVLTSGRRCRRITSPAIVGVNVKRMPNSL